MEGSEGKKKQKLESESEHEWEWDFISDDDKADKDPGEDEVYVYSRKWINTPQYSKIAQLALDHYNQRHGTDYIFHKNLSMHSCFTSYEECYFTFQAQHADADAFATPETFRAGTYTKLGLGDTTVAFCWIKRKSGDKKSLDSNDDVKATP